MIVLRLKTFSPIPLADHSPSHPGLIVPSGMNTLEIPSDPISGKPCNEVGGTGKDVLKECGFLLPS